MKEQRAYLHERSKGNKEALAAVPRLLGTVAAEAGGSRLEQSFKVPEDAMQGVRALRSVI